MPKMNVGEALDMVLDDIMELPGTWQEKRDALLDMLSERGKEQLNELAAWINDGE